MFNLKKEERYGMKNITSKKIGNATNIPDPDLKTDHFFNGSYQLPSQ